MNGKDYTFAGTKIMARFSFDMKGLIPADSLFGLLGKEDLKLYGEATILGLKNYPDPIPRIMTGMTVCYGVCR